jgi:threonine dehydratase
MPTTAPAIKVEGTRKHGAEVLFAGTTTLHRLERATEVAASRGLTMVPPFDHEWIIAGQGTLGLEILEQMPDVRTVLVPVGGGGLISGVAAGIKQTSSSVSVVGVEPAGAASMKASVDAGEPVTLAQTQSIADGLMAVRPGDLNFMHVQTFVDHIVTIEDDEIARAVSWLYRRARIVAEPSDAAAAAAALSIARFAPPVVAVISGGNIGPADLAKYTSQA